MVTVENKKTGLQYNFTVEQWKSCLSKGIAGKFRVISGGEGIKAESAEETTKGTLHFTPPEITEPKAKKKKEKKEEQK